MIRDFVLFFVKTNFQKDKNFNSNKGDSSLYYPISILSNIIRDIGGWGRFGAAVLAPAGLARPVWRGGRFGASIKICKNSF